MAVGRIQLSAEVLGLNETLANLRAALNNEQKSRILEKALQKAVKPVKAALDRTVPLGPTGNLRRAIDVKVVRYPLDGNAVAVVGFRRSGRRRSQSAAGGRVRTGRDRAFHQWWLEEGTRERFVSSPADRSYIRKSHQRRMQSGTVAQVREHTVARQGGYIASSYNRLGPFRMTKPTTGDRSRVQTQPGYPRAFFRKSSQPIRIPPMPAGGESGQPPLRTAFAQSQSAVAEILSRELRASLEQVWAALGVSTSPTGTVE